ncbi:MAG TPA: alpha-amylase family glycosyl hydrolase [Candidatus Binatia bacterium]|nr:alpha-amylase family glycosyl hydrolase [Candidatus Binatia bacterium]
MPDTPAWVRDAVFYQVFPDRFAGSQRVVKPGPLEPWDAPPTNHGFKGGDLLGIVEHLDHIESLAVNALYLTPVFQSASNHRYHTYDYFRVDPLLGGDEALRELLDAVHARGMRMLLDGVFNHTGRGFWPFHHVLETGAGSPYRTWFYFDEEALARGVPLNAYPAAGRLRNGVATDEPAIGETEGHPGEKPSARQHLGYEAWWGLPALPKLNIGEPAVREYIWGVAEHWLRFGIDGWRLDVPGEIDDPSFWAEFRRRCRAVNPEAYLVGEIWGVAPEWVAGDRFDALMNYPLAKAIIGFVGGSSLDEPLLRSHDEYGQAERLDGAGFARRLGELTVAYAPETVAAQLNLLGSHDTPRAFSLFGRDREAMELAVLLQATLPGAPCLYYGDEIGLEGGLDPDSRRAFPWDEGRWDHELLELVRGAFRLRRAEPALRADGVEVRSTVEGGLAFERRAGDRRLGVAVNAADAPVRLDAGNAGDAGAVDATARAGAPGPTVLLAAGRARTEPPAVRGGGAEGAWSVELPPRSGVVVALA